MSFSSDCKRELCLVKPEKSCCGLSELCGLYVTMGSLSLLGRGRVNVQFSGESPCGMPQGLYAAGAIPAPYPSNSLRNQRAFRRHAQMRAHAGAGAIPGAFARPGHDGIHPGKRLFPPFHNAPPGPYAHVLHARVSKRRAAGRRHHDQPRAGLSSGAALSR